MICYIQILRLLHFNLILVRRHQFRLRLLLKTQMILISPPKLLGWKAIRFQWALIVNLRLEYSIGYFSDDITFCIFCIISLIYKYSFMLWLLWHMFIQSSLRSGRNILRKTQTLRFSQYLYLLILFIQYFVRYILNIHHLIIDLIILLSKLLLRKLTIDLPLCQNHVRTSRIRYACHRHVHWRIVNTHVIFVVFKLTKVDILKIVIYLSYLSQRILIQWIVWIDLETEVAHLHVWFGIAVSSSICVLLIL